MQRTALELPDSTGQKGRLVERDDPLLHVERVEHPSIAGYSQQTFGPGQPLAARARWRRAFTPWMSASPVSQSEGVTMCRRHRRCLPDGLLPHDRGVFAHRRHNCLHHAAPVRPAGGVQLELHSTASSDAEAYVHVARRARRGRGRAAAPRLLATRM